MSSSLVRAEPPSDEPLDLSAARLHLKQSDDQHDDDDLIDALIAAAREFCEAQTGQAFMEQSWRLTLDHFPLSDVIELGHPAVTALVAATYVDASGTSQSLTDLVTLDGDAFPSRLVRNYGTCWPTTRCQRNAVTITYTVGADDPLDVPELVRSAMKLLIGEWYAKREAGATSPNTLDIVRNLLAPLRMVTLA